MEKNALGEVTKRQYDLNNNLEYEWGPNKEYYKKFATDKMNRVTRMDEIYTDGRRFTTTYQYDKKGNKTAVTDIYGNTTHYEYDEFNRVVRVTMPPVLDEDHVVYNPQTTYEYDIFGNVTSETDPKGQTTKTSSTINGKPYFRQYPDGSVERWEYSVRGELKREVKKDGSSITYEHDFASRPKMIKFFDKAENLLKTVVKKYNAFHLRQEIENGQTTNYAYDIAGRLVKVEKNNQLTTYVYDSLGRESERHEYFDDDYLNKITKYDLLNRVTNEIEQDSKGVIFSKIAYEYDVDGNRTSTKTENQAGINETVIEYNPHGQPILKKDALQNETKTCTTMRTAMITASQSPTQKRPIPLGTKPSQF